MQVLSGHTDTRIARMRTFNYSCLSGREQRCAVEQKSQVWECIDRLDMAVRLPRGTLRGLFVHFRQRLGVASQNFGVQARLRRFDS